nr:alpha-(1->3)-arabinofuranosyltransferase family protein [Corynebacterium aquatimens]
MSTVRAAKPALPLGLQPHLVGWIFLTLLAFLQAPGRTAADTKFDLTANPAGFLGQATHAYTDAFTFGQLQNQAYGYLFPQGLFFLLTDPVPDWVAQRLWWSLLLSIAFSGTFILAQRFGLRGPAAFIPALLYALSPRILTTLTAISSEAWPVALVPWTLIPLFAHRLRAHHIAASLIPIALMGAVNAAATMMACLPAALLLVYRHAWRPLLGWLAGCALVSAWWIGPLLILGRYSPPFLDFIESAFVTTRWLNAAEILRGTMSWAPFVDTERVAGHLLVTEPVFILATLAVAAVGFAGLSSSSMPMRGYLVLLLCVGLILLCATPHSLLDGPLAPFRNLHKLDPMVRLPLVLGVGAALSRATRPTWVAVVLVAVIATAPAWTLRLAPLGTWDDIPDGWRAAASAMDTRAAGTRTLIVPEASFVRQDWGWPRDEPIQALSHANFATRDAIPLVDPEAIRGLDGLMAVYHASESAGSAGPSPTGPAPTSLDFHEATRGFGIGAVLDRAGAPIRGGAALDVFDPQRDMMITDRLLTVAGGGEVLPLLDAHFGFTPRTLLGASTSPAARPDIVTDTPALLTRNYGTLAGPVSAHLPGSPSASEGGEIHNHLTDYPSAGTRVAVDETGGTIRASSSAADATAFGGADPSRSVTAAVDGLTDTAWFPAPGDPGWIEVTSPARTATLTTTADTELTLTSGDTTRTVAVRKGVATTVDKPGATLRIALSSASGIAEIDAGVRRIVTVPGVGDNYFFQRLAPPTDVLRRAFTTDRDATFELSAPSLIDSRRHQPGPIHLKPGRHEIVTDAKVVSLTSTIPPAPASPTPASPIPGTPHTMPHWAPMTGAVTPADHDRTILSTRAFNVGLRAELRPLPGTSLPGSLDPSTPLHPVRVGAGQQGFIVPAGAGGTFTMTFVADTAYRASLLIGGALSLLTVALCLWIQPARRRSTRETSLVADHAPQHITPVALLIAPAAASVAVAGWAGALVFGIGLAIRRFTLIPGWVLAVSSIGMMALWLARAPWPSANYAGDSPLIALAGALALAGLVYFDAFSPIPDNVPAGHKPAPRGRDHRSILPPRDARRGFLDPVVTHVRHGNGHRHGEHQNRHKTPAEQLNPKHRKRHRKDRNVP